MKKILPIILVFSLVLSIAENVCADEKITVKLNDEEIVFTEAQPFMENNRVLVPMRAIFEALGAEVSWAESTRTVYAYNYDNFIELPIDSDLMTVNYYNIVTLDVPAQIVGDRTMVPLRAVAEGMQCEVDWDAAAKMVSIKKDMPSLIIVEPTPVPAYKQGEPIQILTMAFNAESASADSPVTKKLEEIAGNDFDIKWSPVSSYDERFITAIGSGTYPHVMLVNGASSTFINAARNDLFWDITDKLTDTEKFPNLSKTNPVINRDISIDGKVYGLYRSREIGRAGISIRKDWLDNLGMEIPKTLNDFYNVLKAFTENDPDGNGLNDTYGMIVTNYLEGPLNNLAVWMGAPNGWGLDENGELKPAFMFDEYRNALDFMKKCYEEGLINPDMAVMSGLKWNEPFLNSEAGVIIDVADRARRLEQNMDKKGCVDVFGYVTRDENTTPRTLPTAGYDDYYVFPKAMIETEEDLDYILTVIDKLNSPEATDLMNFGIEGIHYDLDADGYVIEKEDYKLKYDYNDLNQFSLQLSEPIHKKRQPAIADKVDNVYEDNRQYIVPNPAEPYVVLSDSYRSRGPQLDSIIDEANVKYIVGQITSEEYDSQIERWKSVAGNDVIKEVNEAYFKNSDFMRFILP